MRFALGALALALAACTPAMPGADSTSASAEPGAATPPAAPAAPVAAESARGDSAPAGAVARDSVVAGSQDTTPARPGLRPRPPRPVPRPVPPGANAAVPAAEQADVDRLRREVKALARAGGCTSVDQCRALPIGARPCGGPEEYVVYCPRTTDVAALERKAAELERVQKAFNEKQGLMSTCEYRMPPRLALVGGSCRAAPSAGAPDVPAVPEP